MKSSFFKVAVPALALGLAFAPVASAAPKDAHQKTTVTKDSKTTVSKSDSKAKCAPKKVSAKEKVAIKQLSPITKNVAKVEASLTKLSTVTTSFYAKTTTTVSVKAEAEFFATTSGKLKANSNQLKALKKQVDHVAKKYKGTDALTATYKKITDLNAAISTASKNLTDLHNQFRTTVKEQEAKKQLTPITDAMSKVEASVTELSATTKDFYEKKATDSAVTAQVEADFFTKTTGLFQDNTKQLATLKEQLNALTKKYGNTADVTAADSKITAQNLAISAAVEALNNYHTSFKPVPPTTTNP